MVGVRLFRRRESSASRRRRGTLRLCMYILFPLSFWSTRKYTLSSSESSPSVGSPQPVNGHFTTASGAARFFTSPSFPAPHSLPLHSPPKKKRERSCSPPLVLLLVLVNVALVLVRRLLLLCCWPSPLVRSLAPSSAGLEGGETTSSAPRDATTRVGGGGAACCRDPLGTWCCLGGARHNNRN